MWKKGVTVIIVSTLVISLAAMLVIFRKEGSRNVEASKDFEEVSETIYVIPGPVTVSANAPEIANVAEARAYVCKYADEHGIDMSAYPDDLIELLANNPETYQFVCEYPRYKGVNTVEDISDDLYGGGVPLLLQWDIRWGYKDYGSNMMALTGCGPTCLSMVSSYLLADTSLTPSAVADFAMENGYYDTEYNSGTLWTLMSEGAEDLGLTANEVPLDPDCIRDSLMQGHPLIMSMGPGEFTSEGHFIVVTGMVNDQFRINDPNSIARSSRLWDYEEFADQVQAIWEFSAA